jgi:phosphomevalonate kinase
MLIYQFLIISFQVSKCNNNLIFSLYFRPFINTLFIILFYNRWDNQVTKFSFPPEFTLILADVDAGSHTPSMVGKVLKWRKENADQG